MRFVRSSDIAAALGPILACVALASAQTQPAERPKATTTAGTLVAVSEHGLTLRIKAGDADQDVVIADADVTVRLDGEAVTTADLRPPVDAVVTRRVGAGLPREQVRIVVRTPAVSGTLTAVDGPSLTLRTPRGETVAVTSDPAVRIRVPAEGPNAARDGQFRDGTAADLQPGVRVEVRPTTGPATRITLRPARAAASAPADAARPPAAEPVYGLIVSADAASVTLSAKHRDGSTSPKTVPLSPGTPIVILSGDESVRKNAGTAGTTADLGAGKMVRVVYEGEKVVRLYVGAEVRSAPATRPAP